jgi:hypothetical protein
MAVIDADLERLADELDARRAAGDPAVLPQKGPEVETQPEDQDDANLIQAASEILVSLSDNQSEKFQNSSFLKLMRSITNKDVLVRGNDFVDSKTKAVIVNVDDSNTDSSGDDIKGKGKETA